MSVRPPPRRGGAHPRTPRRLAAPVAAFIAAALIAGCAHAPPAGTGGIEAELIALDGGQVSLGRYGGRVLLVTFFTTWCLPCIAEIPYLNRLQAEHPELTVIGISLDEGGEDVLRPFIDHFEVRYPVLQAGPEVRAGRSGFGVIEGVPASFLLDRERRPVLATLGLLEPRTLEPLLEEVLAGKREGRPLKR